MTIELRQNLKAIIGARGGSWVDLPTLLPANTLLELAGENLRPRLYFTNSPDGEELCLRADLTISAALYYLENCPDQSDFTLLCEGKVFRAPTIAKTPAEFTQIGIEKYTDKNPIDADVETLLSMYSAIIGAGLSDTIIRLSDGSLFETIISRANILPVWRNYLLARSKSIDGLESGIKDALSHQKSELSQFETNLINQSEEIAQDLVLEIIEANSFQTGPARSIAEIAKRIRSKAELKTAEPLPSEFGEALLKISKIDNTPKKAIENIVSICANLGIEFNDWADEWIRRLDILAGDIDAATEIKFQAMTGARFEYYDGMIFEIAPKANPNLAIAFGGRYDGLIKALSNGERTINAVGAVIRPERLAGAIHVQ